jgi:polyisoprenoid-binding protein YceI
MSTPALSSVIPSGSWNLDSIHSSATFSVKHMVVSTFRGNFEEVDASIDPETQTMRGVVRVQSLAIRDPNLLEQLLGDSFFAAEQYPEISFVSTGFRGSPDDLILDGELTVRDRTRPLQARGSIAGPHQSPFGQTVFGFELETVIDRREFGLDWNMELPTGGWALGNDVTLTVDLEFVLAEVEG